jgi:hypothetical protein
MLCYYLACSFCKIDLKLEVISFTELVFCVQCSVSGRERGCPLASLEPQTSDRALILGEGFLGELDCILVLSEGFLGELKLVLDLVEGFLEELKLVLVLVELFCLLVQQL